MIITLEYSKIRSTRWKNGGGYTREIAIEPATAVFPQDGFGWRLSCAEVTTNGPFSNFPGCDRLLLVWKGRGMRLNGIELQPLEITRFPGDVPMTGELVDGEVTDLGLIYQRDQYACDFKVLKFTKDELFQIQEDSKTFLVFCLEGRLRLNEEVIDSLMFAQLNDERFCEIQALADSTFVLVEIEKIN